MEIFILFKGIPKILHAVTFLYYFLWAYTDSDNASVVVVIYHVYFINNAELTKENTNNFI